QVHSEIGMHMIATDGTHVAPACSGPTRASGPPWSAGGWGDADSPVASLGRSSGTIAAAIWSSFRLAVLNVTVKSSGASDRCRQGPDRRRHPAVNRELLGVLELAAVTEPRQELLNPGAARVLQRLDQRLGDVVLGRHLLDQLVIPARPTRPALVRVGRIDVA